MARKHQYYHHHLHLHYYHHTHDHHHLSLHRRDISYPNSLTEASFVTQTGRRCVTALKFWGERGGFYDHINTFISTKG